MLAKREKNNTVCDSEKKNITKSDRTSTFKKVYETQISFMVLTFRVTIDIVNSFTLEAFLDSIEINICVLSVNTAKLVYAHNTSYQNDIVSIRRNSLRFIIFIKHLQEEVNTFFINALF